MMKVKDGTLMRIGDAAAYIGVCTKTLRRWHESGKLKPQFIGDGGTRYYTKTQLDKIRGS